MGAASGFRDAPCSRGETGALSFFFPALALPPFAAILLTFKVGVFVAVATAGSPPSGGEDNDNRIAVFRQQDFKRENRCMVTKPCCPVACFARLVTASLPA